MTTINIAYEVPADTVEKVQAYLDDAALRDPSWNGAEFTIEREEFTWIPDARDEYAATALLLGILRIIRGENE